MSASADHLDLLLTAAERYGVLSNPTRAALAFRLTRTVLFFPRPRPGGCCSSTVSARCVPPSVAWIRCWTPDLRAYRYVSVPTVDPVEVHHANQSGEVLTHDGLQRPPQAATRQLRPRLGRAAGVLAPHMPTPGTPVAADGDQQRRRAPPQRFVRQASDHRVPRGTLAPAPATPLIGLDDTTRQHRTIRVHSLPDHLQTQLVETSERSQIRASEGSVRHVEVPPAGSMRTPIIRRPRPLRRHRPADPRYTLNCDEPVKLLRFFEIFPIPPDLPS